MLIVFPPLNKDVAEGVEMQFSDFSFYLHFLDFKILFHMFKLFDKSQEKIYFIKLNAINFSNISSDLFMYHSHHSPLLYEPAKVRLLTLKTKPPKTF